MNRRAAVALLAAALALQGAIAALGFPLSGRALAGDEAMYVALARDWAAGRPAAIDPLWPPGYPALLAAWLAAGGGLPAFLALQILAHLAAGALLARLAWRVTESRWVAGLAAALFLLDPQIAAFAQTYWPETLHLLLVLLLLLAAVEGVARERGAVAFGAATGAALLLKSLLTPFVPLLAWAAFRAAPEERRLRCWALARGTLLALVALALVVLPVLLSNHRRHGFWGIADSTRFNVVLGLTDRSPRSLRDDRAHAVALEYHASGATFAERQAALARRLRDEVASRGIPAILADRLPRQYFRLFDRESYFAAMLPGSGALAAVGQGFRDPPRPLAAALAVLGYVLHAVVLAAAPLGLVLLSGWRPRRFWPLLAFLSYQLAIFVLLHVKARYRLPMLPVLDLAAATAIVGLVEKLRRERDDPWPAGAWLGGLVGGVSLLLLGFGADRFG